MGFKHLVESLFFGGVTYPFGNVLLMMELLPGKMHTDTHVTNYVHNPGDLQSHAPQVKIALLNLTEQSSSTTFQS